MCGPAAVCSSRGYAAAVWCMHGSHRGSSARSASLLPESPASLQDGQNTDINAGGISHGISYQANVACMYG